MSRKEKFSRSRKNKHHETEAYQYLADDADVPTQELPSRRKKHPSSKNKLTKIYYNVLFVLFVSLVAFLFWYGNKYAYTP